MSELPNAGRQPAREAVRAPSKPVKLKPGEYFGRDGNVITRQRNYTFNQFDIPTHMLEDGWSYQWNRASVYNQPDPAEINRMMDNGWTYVDANSPRWKNFLCNAKAKEQGHIELDGLVLMERPQGMTDEAKAELKALAEERVMRQIERADTDMELPDGYKAEKRKVKKGRPEAVPDALRSAPAPRRGSVVGDDD